MSVQLISAPETYELRSRILRNNRLKPEECAFSEDDTPGAFHLGFFEDGKIVGVASLNIQAMDSYDSAVSYRLRGMAVASEGQRTGIGSELLRFAVEHLRTLGAEYLWCNARVSARDFYKKHGFEEYSEEFEIAGIGTHVKMKIRLSA